MTPEQKAKRTDEKIEQLKTFIRGLQLDIVPEQIMLKNGIIRLVITYIDNEIYPEEVKTVAPDTTVQQ
jgi:hypothetical protein